jgi:hypothetical protein
MTTHIHLRATSWFSLRDYLRDLIEDESAEISAWQDRGVRDGPTQRRGRLALLLAAVPALVCAVLSVALAGTWLMTSAVLLVVRHGVLTCLFALHWLVHRMLRRRVAERA